MLLSFHEQQDIHPICKLRDEMAWGMRPFQSPAFGLITSSFPGGDKVSTSIAPTVR